MRIRLILKIAQHFVTLVPLRISNFLKAAINWVVWIVFLSMLTLLWNPIATKLHIKATDFYIGHLIIFLMIGTICPVIWIIGGLQNDWRRFVRHIELDLEQEILTKHKIKKQNIRINELLSPSDNSNELLRAHTKENGR